MTYTTPLENENINTLEKAKFGEENNLVYVRTRGAFSLSGLNIDQRVTTMLVGDTAIPLPAVALPQRNSIIIHNKSGANTVYIGKSNVTADSVVGTTSGWEISPGSYYATDVTDAIVIYGRCVSGQSALIKIYEVA